MYMYPRFYETEREREREDTTEIYLENRQNPCELECFLSVHDDYSLLGCGAL
jgi:hypothetical protein